MSETPHLRDARESVMKGHIHPNLCFRFQIQANYAHLTSNPPNYFPMLVHLRFAQMDFHRQIFAGSEAIWP